MKIRGAIFDLDGTLLDSMYIWDSIGEEYLRSLGIEPLEDLRETFKNMSLYQAARYYRKEYGVTLSIEEIMNGVNRRIEHFYQNEVTVKPGVLDFLEALRKKDVRLCIATATDRYLAEAALQRNKLLGYFEEIFTCSSVGHGKDEPDIFYAAQTHLEIPKESTLVLEDALYAIQTARQAGFPVMAVYDRSEPAQDSIRALADYYTEDFTNAKEVLL